MSEIKMVTHGIKLTLVTSSMIDSISIVQGTILQQGNLSNGFEIKFRHENPGGCDYSGMQIILKDIIPWTHITFQWLGNLTGACWWFNTNYGTFSNGNISNYNESLGDRVSRCYLSWEVSDFQPHLNKIAACDNEPTNFMRYNSAKYKSFYMTSRRSVNGSLAGLTHVRACNAINGISIFKNIFIW